MTATTDPWTIGEEHIALAQKASADGALRSPLVPAPWLGKHAWLKLELELPTGSFKVRGALTYLSQRASKAGVVAASAGNHGLGLAFAARRMAVPLKVFVSASLPDIKLNGMRELGATLELCDETSYDEVEARARQAAKDGDLDFVSPFDDPFIAAGNGAAPMMEVLEALPDIRRVVVPVGGGGLLAGVVAAIRSRRLDVEIVGVESEMSDAMRRSLHEGAARTRLAPEGITLAEGLEGGVCASTFSAAKAGGVRAAVVSEEDIALAMVALRKQLGRDVEGSGAASVAWGRLPDNQDDATTVYWVSGGNVDPERVQALAGGWRPKQGEGA